MGKRFFKIFTVAVMTVFFIFGELASAKARTQQPNPRVSHEDRELMAPSIKPTRRGTQIIIRKKGKDKDGDDTNKCEAFEVKVHQERGEHQPAVVHRADLLGAIGEDVYITRDNKIVRARRPNASDRNVRKMIEEGKAEDIELLLNAGVPIPLAKEMPQMVLDEIEAQCKLLKDDSLATLQLPGANDPVRYAEGQRRGDST